MNYSQSLSTTTLTPSTTSQTSFSHFMGMMPVTSGAAATGISDIIHYDNQPASAAFLSGYSKCVALYLSYLITHPDWKRTPARTLVQAMETKPETPQAQQAFFQMHSYTEFILNHLSWMQFRETEYVMALGLLERFLEHTKVLEDTPKRFELSSSTVPMTIVVSLMLANKLSDDTSFYNVQYCQALSISQEDLQMSEVYFLECLGMNLSLNEEQLVELVRICESGLKMF